VDGSAPRHVEPAIAYVAFEPKFLDSIAHIFGVPIVLVLASILTLLLVVFAGYVGVREGVALFADADWFVRSAPGLGFAVGLLCVPLLAMVNAMQRQYNRIVARRREARLPPDDPARLYFRACAVTGRTPIGQLSRRRRVEWVVETKLPPFPAAFVDARLKKSFQNLVTVEQPLEPESLNRPQWKTLIQYLVVMGLTAVVVTGIASALSRGYSTIFLVGGLAVVAMLLAVPFWPGVATEIRTPPVVGQGWVERGAKRWTSQDSALLVTRHGLGAMRLMFVGPPGTFQCMLEKGPEGGLLEFWQRWAHPHPNFTQRAFDA
jgi:hypothetical protein